VQVIVGITQYVENLLQRQRANVAKCSSLSSVKVAKPSARRHPHFYFSSSSPLGGGEEEEEARGFLDSYESLTVTQ
jgi:hypothetical protein